MRRFWRLLWDVLREISDERAYALHLARHGVQHSPEEWRRFCDEHWPKASRRAGCC